MSSALHTVAETAQFQRDAKDAGVTADEMQRIVQTVAANPLAGDEVVGSGGVRKVRIAGKGKGKSGGYRIMVAYVGPEAPAYVLALLSKGERGNFSDAEVKAFKVMTTALGGYWLKRRK